MSGLRVIGGTARGRPLRLVPGTGTRPIGDRVKQALFNILGADVEGSRWLDLFAGTGSVGIEALSRGASHAVFVDSSEAAIRTILQNLTATDFTLRAKVVKRDAFAFLEARAQDRLDYVYLAPPQYQGLWVKALQAVDAAAAILDPDAWVIVQIDPREDKVVEGLGLTRFDERTYGQTRLIFFRAEAVTE
jgi:16S rRNA (guanine966-N2)-methyltransferase